MIDLASDDTEQTEATPPSVEAATIAPAEPQSGPAPIAPVAERAHGSDAAPERRRRHFGRRRVCGFCVDKATAVDYKDAVKLRRYLSDRARIEPRRKTGTCAKHQRWLAVALKRARHLALLPYAPEHIRLSGAFTVRR